jgi:hypothetical protein
MQIKTRQMSFSKALDEVWLRFLLLGLRVVQALISIPIIGFAAGIIGDFNHQNLNVPNKATAVEAIACVSAVYVGLTFFPIFFGGPLFFLSVGVIDLALVAPWAWSVAAWQDDGNATCSRMRQKYFTANGMGMSYEMNCNMVRAMFAFLIINL